MPLLLLLWLLPLRLPRRLHCLRLRLPLLRLLLCRWKWVGVGLGVIFEQRVYREFGISGVGLYFGFWEHDGAERLFV